MSESDSSVRSSPTQARVLPEMSAATNITEAVTIPPDPPSPDESAVDTETASTSAAPPSVTVAPASMYASTSPVMLADVSAPFAPTSATFPTTTDAVAARLDSAGRPVSSPYVATVRSPAFTDAPSSTCARVSWPIVASARSTSNDSAPAPPPSPSAVASAVVNASTETSPVVSMSAPSARYASVLPLIVVIASAPAPAMPMPIEIAMGVVVASTVCSDAARTSTLPDPAFTTASPTYASMSESMRFSLSDTPIAADSTPIATEIAGTSAEIVATSVASMFTSPVVVTVAPPSTNAETVFSIVLSACAPAPDSATLMPSFGFVIAAETATPTASASIMFSDGSSGAVATEMSTEPAVTVPPEM